MGKTGSDGAGVLFLRDAPDVLASKIKRAATDAGPTLSFDPTRRPGVANLAILLGALTGTTPQLALDGLAGASALKSAVTDAVIATLEPIQQRYDELMDDPTGLNSLLAADRDSLAPIAGDTVTRARDAIGLLAVV
jgi:tryptophanyl-tRNA synthetase